MAPGLLFIGDASGLTQDFEHSPGKTSYGPFLARGWKIIPTVKMRVQSRAPKNPSVARSLKECNRLIRERRVWCLQKARDAGRAGQLRAQAEQGRSPAGPLRHQADGLRYVAWWVEPPARASTSRPGPGGGGA